jgi:hypothetical protein
VFITTRDIFCLMKHALIGSVVVLMLAACDQGDGATDSTTDPTPETTHDTTPEPEPDPADDPAPDPTVEAEPDGTAPCAPSWHPTSCGDCGGGGDGTGCWQDCTSCDDGSTYRAECDTATNICHCYIDDAEACTCTPTHSPGDSMGCQPEEWGGANCCWNVG